ncbi:threonine synthase [Hujiaoplasma nucleasis]|uniref:Threonine synthase n=1 Tax=Hujiaoplasma nucleasis TaxID=2725268 RepID=A0A7L6N4K6_9MOLU|nr:threonine synthase [Hujiaoplasma nucleasis]QLY39509.1 threonine synthase [Hujiaoplasma nucleasis]
MTYVKGLRCTHCNHFYPFEKDLMICPNCQEKGILDIEYKYKEIKEVMNRDYFKNNLDLSIWRYLPLLPVEEKYTKNSLRVGWTPLYKSFNLQTMIDIKSLYIKDEGLNPTQSLKDRASVIACVKALENNYEIISCSSTGNAASSLAGNAAKLGLKTVIFVPKRAPVGKLTQLLVFGADLIKVNGDYKSTYQLSKAAISHYGWYNRNAAVNPYLVEGKKTVALEIAEQLEFNLTDWVIVSVGDGCTIGGVYKGFYDLIELGLIDRMPKLLGVQSEGCSPFYKAFHEEKEMEESEENTLADSIAVGIPRNPIKGLKAVKNSHGSFEIVSDDEIMDAMLLLAKYEGVFAEPAAAAGLAGLMKSRKKNLIKPSDTATVIITGNGLKDTKNALNVINEPVLLNNDLKDLIDYIERGESNE